MTGKAQVVLRADASAEIGMGHLMRANALARALADAGVVVKVATRTRDARLLDDLRGGLPDVVELEVDSFTEDARATAAVAIDGATVVVDGYHFDTAYFGALRALGCRTVAIEDKVRLPEYGVDVVLDQNPGALRQPYDARSARLLLGPRFVLLRRPASPDPRPRQRSRVRVLATFGGSDVGNVMPRVLRALAQVPDIDVTAILGALNPRTAQILDEFGGVSHFELIRHMTDLPTLMRECDVAICAVGGTLWELAAAGIPTLMISSTDVQRPIAAIAHAYGAHRWIGDTTEVYAEHIRTEFLNLLDDQVARAQMARLGPALIDGRGAQRVARALQQAPGDWTIRPPQAEDIEPIWEIASDPSVRQMAFDSRTFSFPEHEAWFLGKAASGATRFWVIENDGTIGGFIRYDRSDDGSHAEIDVATAAAARRRGLATRLLNETWREACRSLGVGCVRGVVLEGNVGSERAFMAAGFGTGRCLVLRERRCSVFERGVGAACVTRTGVSDGL